MVVLFFQAGGMTDANKETGCSSKVAMRNTVLVGVRS